MAPETCLQAAMTNVRDIDDNALSTLSVNLTGDSGRVSCELARYSYILNTGVSTLLVRSQRVLLQGIFIYGNTQHCCYKDLRTPSVHELEVT